MGTKSPGLTGQMAGQGQKMQALSQAGGGPKGSKNTGAEMAGQGGWHPPMAANQWHAPMENAPQGWGGPEQLEKLQRALKIRNFNQATAPLAGMGQAGASQGESPDYARAQQALQQAGGMSGALQNASSSMAPMQPAGPMTPWAQKQQSPGIYSGGGGGGVGGGETFAELLARAFKLS